MIEALFQSGALTTPYVRAGDGTVVLLVRAGSCAEIACSTTFRVLAERHRVIGVAPPPGAGTDWLRDLIDGLGLNCPELIGDPEHGPLLRAFAEAHSDRISQLTLLEGAERTGDPSG